MKAALIGALGLWAWGGAVMAEQATVRKGTVVELYTSQGCSSCPPADEYLSALAQDAGVIVLSLHVDYWDYIGWRDSFGQARFTERQKAYARAEGSRTIYTPQIIVAGGARIEGVNPTEVEAAVKADQAAGQALDLRLRREGERLTIEAPAAGQPVRVQLVRFLPHAQVMIEEGENAGRLVDYVNVVTSWEALADWDGAAPLALEARVEGGEGVVVILQAEGPGRILAAAEAE